MIKMKVDELVFEMKEEMICYEQLGEEKAAQWEKNFYLWLENKNIKKKRNALYSIWRTNTLRLWKTAERTSTGKTFGRRYIIGGRKQGA